MRRGSYDLILQIKAAGFVLMIAIPALGPLGYMIGAPWLAALAIFIIVPLLDFVIGKDWTNPVGRTRLATGSVYFYWIPHFYLASWLTSFFWVLARLSSESQPNGDIAWLVVALGISSSFATCAAHELLHRGNNLDYWVSRVTMAICCYGHFVIEHLHHHATAGIQTAGTVPRRGESLYAFVWRNIKFGFSNTYLIEERIRSSRGRGWWTNRVLQQYFLSVLVGALVTYFFGAAGLVVFVVQAFFAIFTLEMIQYFEHYGLERVPSDPLGPRESWNSNYWLTNAITLNITRHSDHHINAKIPYQSLQAHPQGPEMPLGYFGLVWLALFPPLWRRVIDPILDALPSDPRFA